jgi:hypothetical protein
VMITIAVQNIGRGGVGLDRHPGLPEELVTADRWPLLVERLARIDWPEHGISHKPALLGLNECSNWTDARLQTAAEDLGLAPVGLTPANSGYPSALLYDPEQLGSVPEWNTNHNTASHHGIGVARGVMPGWPQKFGLVLGHITPFSPDAAVAEAKFWNCRAYREGALAFAMGDCNYLSHVKPSWDERQFAPYNWANRFHRPAPYYWYPRTWIGRAIRTAPLKVWKARPDLRVSKAMRAADMFDVAALMWQRTGDKRYLEWTCPSMRIDWILVSEALTAAVVDYQVLKGPNPWASDHHAVALLLDTDRVDDSSALFEYH